MTKSTTVSLYLVALLISVVTRGADLHVSPLGTPQGNGTLQFPLDLATALSGVQGGPGDTFWLHGGTYRGQFLSALRGRPEDRITVRQFPGERAIIDGSIIQDSGGYVTYWGFELTSSYPSHDSSQADSAPLDLPTTMGMNLRAPGLRLVNLIIHDHTSNGIGLWSESPDSEIYGCIIYHNGWDGTDRGHGHGIYSQNRIGSKRFADNISFQNYSDGIQIYGTGAAFLNNFDLEGNVLFNNGIISRWPGGSNLQLGGGVAANGIVLRDNLTYSPFSLAAAVNIGSEISNNDLIFENNLIQGTLRIMNWGRSTMVSNLIFSVNSLLELQQLVPSVRVWDWNSYHSDELDFSPFSLVTEAGSFALTFPLWQMLTGQDGASTYQRGMPATGRVMIRPNAYEWGRGHVVAYNWERKTEVEADLSPILIYGSRFEARNAQNILGPSVLSGVYTGQTIRLPMYATWPIAAPVGRAAPPPTGPDFNVFVFQSLLAESDSYMIQEDEPINVPWTQLLVNDGALGAISNLIVLSDCGTSQRGGLFCLTNGWLAYRTPTNYSGVDYFEYRVQDSLGIISTGDVFVSIQPLPDPPAANTDRVSAVEDERSEWRLTEFLFNDTDPDGDEITIESVASPSLQGGIVTLEAGMIRYTPPTNYFGNDQFTYRLVDATQLAATGRVVVAVAPVNDPPAALSQQLETLGGTALDIVLQATDVDNEPLQYEIVIPPQFGVLQGGEGHLRYVPYSHYTGEDQFTFKATDGVDASEPATVTITVLHVNDPPLARNTSVSLGEGTSQSFRLQAIDPDGDPLTYEIIAFPGRGTVEGTPPELIYTAPPNYGGIEELRFRVSDGQFFSDEATVEIIVTSVGLPPEAIPQSLVTTEDTPLALQLKGRDLPGKRLSFAVTSLTQNGALNGASPNLIYTPNPDFYGEDSFTFTVSNGVKTSKEAVVSVLVLSVNDAPDAFPSNVVTIQNKAVNLMLRGVDVDGDPIQYAVTTPPEHGRLIGVPPSLTYWPDPGYIGPDLFRFQTLDGQTNSAEALISIQVTPPDSAPQPPSIISTSFQQGRLNLELRGEPERSYIIQATKDMISWVSISTNYSDITGAFTYEAPLSSDLSQQFYRVIHPSDSAE